VAEVTIQAEVEGLRRELKRACELAEKLMLRRSYYSAGYMEGRREKLKLEERANLTGSVVDRYKCMVHPIEIPWHAGD